MALQLTGPQPAGRPGIEAHAVRSWRRSGEHSLRGLEADPFPDAVLLIDVELEAPLSPGSGEGQRRRGERRWRWSEGGLQSRQAGCRT
jgi:hypothetical protein